MVDPLRVSAAGTWGPQGQRGPDTVHVETVCPDLAPRRFRRHVHAGRVSSAVSHHGEPTRPVLAVGPGKSLWTARPHQSRQDGPGVQHLVAGGWPRTFSLPGSSVRQASNTAGQPRKAAPGGDIR